MTHQCGIIIHYHLSRKDKYIVSKKYLYSSYCYYVCYPSYAAKVCQKHESYTNNQTRNPYPHYVITFKPFCHYINTYDPRHIYAVDEEYWS